MFLSFVLQLFSCHILTKIQKNQTRINIYSIFFGQSSGVSARKQLFCKLWLCVGLCGLQMCCFVRGLSFYSNRFSFQSFSSKLSDYLGFLQHLAVTAGGVTSLGARGLGFNPR